MSTKRAVILHGTDASPKDNWFPWLQTNLEEQGYEVWVPELPNNHTPNRIVYNDFLFSNEWDFSDNVVIGHSSGAVSVLNLLMDERCPQIKLGLMVSAWDHGVPTDMDYEQFMHLFPNGGFDFSAIREKADNLAFVHSADDPYCPLEQAKYLAENLHAPLTIIENGIHLGSNYQKFPLLLDIINQNS